MLNFIGILIERRKTYLILCILYVAKVVVEHFYAFQKDIGAPLVQKGIAVGMLIKILSDGHAIYINLYKTYNEINEMRSKRFVRPIDRLPRRRARGDQCDSVVQKKKEKFPKKE